jgi:hypothetical protein
MRIHNGKARRFLFHIGFDPSLVPAEMGRSTATDAIAGMKIAVYSAQFISQRAEIRNA